MIFAFIHLNISLMALLFLSTFLRVVVIQSEEKTSSSTINSDLTCQNYHQIDLINSFYFQLSIVNNKNSRFMKNVKAVVKIDCSIKASNFFEEELITNPSTGGRKLFSYDFFLNAMLQFFFNFSEDKFDGNYCRRW